jgi:hypothetical protein
LKKAGYKLVSVDTCLGTGGEWPYVKVGEPQKRDSTWVCQPPITNRQHLLPTDAQRKEYLRQKGSKS